MVNLGRRIPVILSVLEPRLERRKHTLLLYAVIAWAMRQLIAERIQAWIVALTMGDGMFSMLFGSCTLDGDLCCYYCSMGEVEG